MAMARTSCILAPKEFNMAKTCLPLILLALLFALSCRAEDPSPRENPAPQPSAGASKVYFTSRIDAQAVRDVYARLERQLPGRIGIKVHFGEEGNQNFLPATLIAGLCADLNATLVETNVLYGGKRGQTASHIKLARDHGFTFAPIDILDSEGNISYDCRLKHFSKVYTGSHFEGYDGFLIFSHFKGHGSAGFGGAIKNISMGLASKEGKRFLHSGDYPIYDQSKCISCGICAASCPEQAISLYPLSIDHLKCIACGKCVTVCPEKVFQIPPDDQQDFLERLVEYAFVLTQRKPMLYINVLANISSSCDCYSRAPRPFLPDIGILASTDLVALEKASHDLVDKAHKCSDAFLKEVSVSGKRQIEFAAELRLGNLEYQLIDIDAAK